VYATSGSLLRLGVELNGGQRIDLEVAEILVYDRAVTETERQQIEAYLHQTYFVPGTAPALPRESELSPDPGTSERVAGDVNGDHVFDSSDLVRLFQIGKYEDDVEDNSIWSEGDWNGDSDFTTADLVYAMAVSVYQRELRHRSLTVVAESTLLCGLIR
jgi:hypothetical protein